MYVSSYPAWVSNNWELRARERLNMAFQSSCAVYMIESFFICNRIQCCVSLSTVDHVQQVGNAMSFLDDFMQSNRGFTALVFAAQNGHTDCLRLLVNAGANVNALEESVCLVKLFEFGLKCVSRLILFSYYRG